MNGLVTGGTGSALVNTSQVHGRVGETSMGSGTGRGLLLPSKSPIRPGTSGREGGKGLVFLQSSCTGGRGEEQRM
jgi:hypothetical protein